MSTLQRAVIVATAAIALLAPAVAGAAGPASASTVASTAGVISTVAGGVGGPAKATTVAVPSPCGVSFAGGYLYATDHAPVFPTAGAAVRKVSLQTGQLTTPAGTGAVYPAGDGGLAVKAGLDSACGVVISQSGSLVFTQADPDNGRVRMVAASTGTFYGQAMTAGHIYTVAGGGTGDLGDGGPATSAKLSNPLGVTVDGAGNLVIADTENNRIRVVAASTGSFYGQAMTTGHIYTVAGDGGFGFSGDGGPATSATVVFPGGVAVDSSGNLVIADTDNRRIRVVAASTGSFYGQAMTAGDIYTVAGGGTGGLGDGGPATSAKLSNPLGVTVDGAGNMLIADTLNNFLTNTFEDRIRVVAASTGTFYGQAMTAGDIYTVAGTSAYGFSGDGGPAARAELAAPSGVAVDSAGNLLIADSGNNRIRVVAASTGSFYRKAMTAGDIYTVAGNGAVAFSGDSGPATRAQLATGDRPQSGDVAVDSAGNLLIADSSNNRIRVAARSTGSFYGQAMTAGHIYTVAGTGAEGFSGDGGRATRAKLTLPQGVAVDAAGNLVIADTDNDRIRVVAASTGSFYRKAMTAGHIYTVAGNGTAGHAGGGGLATAAELYDPAWVTVDSAGNLLIADSSNNRIRVVAASTGTYYGHAMTAGHIYGIAGDGHAGGGGDGGPAIHARLRAPTGVAADSSGNLLIADTGNDRIRVVAARTGTYYGQEMIAGDIYTVAGTGSYGFSGDGGPATSAQLRQPGAVVPDSSGNLVIADTYNYRIRVVAARTGTYYGQEMTAGDIYTVAGTGSYGFSGDGGPATSAEIDLTHGVAVDSAGDLLIADTFNNRIRMVAG